MTEREYRQLSRGVGPDDVYLTTFDATSENKLNKSSLIHTAEGCYGLGFETRGSSDTGKIKFVTGYIEKYHQNKVLYSEGFYEEGKSTFSFFPLSKYYMDGTSGYAILKFKGEGHAEARTIVREVSMKL